jgi:hypothetical protein
LLGLVFVAFLMVVVRPVVSHLMSRDKVAAQEAVEHFELVTKSD